MFMMKSITSVLLICSCCFFSSTVFSATYYVDATNGNDEHTGISESESWKTLAKVKSVGEKVGFRAGDRILLKRGESWPERLYAYGSGIKEDNVIYSAYGTGENPLIQQIYHREYLLHTAAGDNEYITFMNLRISGDDAGIDARTVNHLIFRNIYIFSCETGVILASESGALEHWLLEDVAVHNCNGFGVFCNTDVNFLTVRRLTTSYNKLDGAAFRTGIDNKVEDSVSHHNGEDGFDIGGTNGSMTYLRCVAHNNGSAGFSIKAKNGATGNIQYCLSFNNHDGLEVGNACNSHTNNSVFYNNSYIGVNLNNNYSHSLKNTIIYNNGEVDPLNGIQASYLVGDQTLQMANNCYGVQSGGRTIYVKNVRRFISIEEWKSYSGAGYDYESIVANPQFVDAMNGDFRLKMESLCIDSGQDLGTFLKDGLAPQSSWVDSIQSLDQYNYGSGWEIGAYVYNPTNPTEGLVSPPQNFTPTQGQ